MFLERQIGFLFLLLLLLLLLLLKIVSYNHENIEWNNVYGALTTILLSLNQNCRSMSTTETATSSTSTTKNQYDFISNSNYKRNRKKFVMNSSGDEACNPIALSSFHIILIAEAFFFSQLSAPFIPV